MRRRTRRLKDHPLGQDQGPGHVLGQENGQSPGKDQDQGPGHANVARGHGPEEGPGHVQGGGPNQGPESGPGPGDDLGLEGAAQSVVEGGLQGRQLGGDHQRVEEGHGREVKRERGAQVGAEGAPQGAKRGIKALQASPRLKALSPIVTEVRAPAARILTQRRDQRESEVSVWVQRRFSLTDGSRKCDSRESWTS